MKLLIALVVTVCVSTTLFAEESNKPASSKDEKKDCVFEVRPKLDADKDQLEQDLDAKLAQFDDCIGGITVGGQGQVGSQTSTISPSPGAGTGPQSMDQAELAGKNSSDASQPESTEQEEDAMEDPASLIDNLTKRQQDQKVLEESSRQDNTRDVQNTLLEDDVAKLLREAAEKETDPARKASLQKNYDDYMASRRK